MGELTQKGLKELLSYCPVTGAFTWKEQRAPHVLEGDVAGWMRKDGYREIRVCGKSYLAHRLAWLYQNGVLPEAEIDHINGAKSDNRIENLRSVTHAEQQQNIKLLKRNTSGYPGVHFDVANQKWRACIRVNGSRHYLGYFQTAREAGLAYRAAKKRLHKISPIVRDFSYERRCIFRRTRRPDRAN